MYVLDPVNLALFLDVLRLEICTSFPGSAILARVWRR
jgi:hypothetical protein